MSFSPRPAPIRTCIACGAKGEKNSMMRLVRLAAPEKVVVDGKGKIRGRGANLCESINCLENAIKHGTIVRALNLSAKLTEGDLEEIKRTFAQVLEEREFRKGQKKVTVRVSKSILDSTIKER